MHTLQKMPHLLPLSLWEKRRSNKLPLSSRRKLLLPLTWIQGRSVFGALVGYRLWNPRLLSILFQHANAVVCHSWIFKCVMRTSCEVMASRLRMRQNAPADPRFWSAARAVPYPFFAHAAWNLTQIFRIHHHYSWFIRILYLREITWTKIFRIRMWSSRFHFRLSPQLEDSKKCWSRVWSNCRHPLVHFYLPFIYPVFIGFLWIFCWIQQAMTHHDPVWATCVALIAIRFLAPRTGRLTLIDLESWCLITWQK